MPSLSNLRWAAAFLAATAISTAHAEDSASSGDVDEPAAKAEASEEAFPLSFNFGVGYSFNHANFVESSGDFGTQLLSFNASVGYDITDALSLSGSVGATKSLASDYLNPGFGSKTARHPTELQDIGLGVAWNFVTIPVADIDLSAGFDLGLPSSDASRAAGLLLSLSPSLSASWSGGGFSVSAGIAYAYYINDEPTIQIDCDRAPQNCLISGKDLGEPNALHNLSGNFSVGYKIIDDLKASVSYGLVNGYGAVEFPDDEFTSPNAQTGTQVGLARQSMGVSLSYKLLKKTSVSASMSTGGSIYTNDGKNYRFPLFDTESDLHHRTTYALRLSQSI